MLESGGDAFDGSHPYGEVFLKASIRMLDDVGMGKDGTKTSAHSDWKYEQALCKSLLEPQFAISSDKQAGYLGQYKSVTRSMKSMQDVVLNIADVMERSLALMTWEHPIKTGRAAGWDTPGVILRG